MKNKKIKGKKDFSIIKNFLYLLLAAIGSCAFIFGIIKLVELFFFISKKYNVPYLVLVAIFLVIFCFIGSLIMSLVKKISNRGKK